jgi:hypothetical protein
MRKSRCNISFYLISLVKLHSTIVHVCVFACVCMYLFIMNMTNLFLQATTVCNFSIYDYLSINPHLSEWVICRRR